MRILTKYAALLSVAFLFFAIPALALVNNGVKFDAPFAFTVGDLTMPAGTYTVTQPDPNVAALLIQDADASHSVFIAYTPVDDESPQPETLIGFKKYGDLDFMSRITIAEENIELKLSQSKAEERAAEKAVAVEHTVPATSGGVLALGSAESFNTGN